jgi:hypothetical protein|tara:strand:- start:206 stop:382 length:177 start_codon:yes stop_codon:yes gene_type:complete
MRETSILIADVGWTLIFFSLFYFKFTGEYLMEEFPQIRKGLLTVVGYYFMAAMLWQLT